MATKFEDLLRLRNTKANLRDQLTNVVRDIPTATKLDIGYRLFTPGSGWSFATAQVDSNYLTAYELSAYIEWVKVIRDRCAAEVDALDTKLAAVEEMLS